MADHFEQYVYLADVTPEAALIAWGGFYFRTKGSDGDWLLVDDEQLGAVASRRAETIGARSKPFGHAVVTVCDEAGNVAGRAETSSRNHVWVTGLRPDTRYSYRVVVDGEGWAEGELYDWVPRDGDGGGGLQRSTRSYAHQFRTHPAPSTSVPLSFAVIGDFGWGVRADDPTARRQRRVAQALERAVDVRDVRLLLTAGDNIYLGPKSTPAATGAEDDDWFFTYYQPYRYVLNRVPVYPVVGNHDSSDEEASDDRAQLSDNFFIEERFGAEHTTHRSSLDPGLFYRFRFGRDVDFVAIDTSKASTLEEARFFNHPKHVEFLEDALPDRSAAGDAPAWIIPFSHHPPFCAGPHHANMESFVERLLPLARRAGVRLVISGHEHNFQHSVVDGIHFVVTGAAGKLREGTPTRFEQAHTRAWAAQEHFLLVRAASDGVRVEPIAGSDDGSLELIDARTPEGGRARLPIVIEG